MGIEDDDIARVRDATDLVALVSEYTTLKRVGRRWVGLCPFHSEKSGSFSVNQPDGLYYCFGCGASGDAITFVREKEHLDFVGAVEKLAARAGVTLRYTDEQETQSRRHRQRLTDALAAAVEWYHDRLVSAAEAAPARKYLRSRGLSGDEVRQYRLGWAPTAWDALVRALDVPPEALVEAGLAFRNRSGRLTDAFRGRVLFPIFDPSGRAVAFGGRALPGDPPPKYKNSAESPVYAKSRTLYGLNWAKSAIVQADEAIVCEGYTDVIGFGAVGLGRAVATCGTALTEDHVRLLTNYARRLVLAFDADAAGQSAAARFYEWERRFSVDVAVAALPPGVDPADLARSDPDALRAAVERAVPFLGFRLDRLLATASLGTPEGRARAAEEALAVIAEHPNALVRDQYVMEVASRTRIDPDQLRVRLERSLSPGGGTRTSSGGSRRSARRERRHTSGAPRAERAEPAAGARAVHDVELPDGPPGEDGDPGPGGIWSAERGTVRPSGERRGGGGGAAVREGAELEALRLLVLRPDDIAESLHEVLFADARALAAYRALRAASGVREAIEGSEPDLAALLRRVAAEDSDADAADVVGLLVRKAADGRLAELVSGLGADDDPELFARYADVAAWVKVRTLQLDDPASREEARSQLLAWLVQESEERE